MRGHIDKQLSLVAPLALDALVPERHPLRVIKPLVESALADLSPPFDAMYATEGRPSVPPERLLKGMLLMALFSVRSERMFCEQLAYNMLFRWFLDMDASEKPFVPTVFTHNRERLLEHDAVRKFFDAVVELARARDLLSSEHFSVDGTLIQAWGSTKSFRPKDDEGGDNNGFADFKGETRTNDTHASKTDPDAKLWRKGRGREANLSHMAHALMENRNGLLVDVEVTEASGTAERTAALTMVDREQKRRAKRMRKAQKGSRKKQRGRRITLAADKGYDTKDFVKACRERRVTPHVAQHKNARRGSAVDARTTRHVGYPVSSIARRLIEKTFGWMKGVGGVRRSRFRGRRRTAAAVLMAASAFNLVCIANLTAVS